MKHTVCEPIPEHSGGIPLETWDDMTAAQHLGSSAHAWTEQARWIELHSPRTADLLRSAAAHALITRDDLDRKNRRVFEAAGVEWPENHTRTVRQMKP